MKCELCFDSFVIQAYLRLLKQAEIKMAKAWAKGGI